MCWWWTRTIKEDDAAAALHRIESFLAGDFLEAVVNKANLARAIKELERGLTTRALDAAATRSNFGMRFKQTLSLAAAEAQILQCAGLLLAGIPERESMHGAMAALALKRLFEAIALVGQTDPRVIRLERAINLAPLDALQHLGRTEEDVRRVMRASGWGNSASYQTRGPE